MRQIASDFGGSTILGRRGRVSLGSPGRLVGLSPGGYLPALTAMGQFADSNLRSRWGIAPHTNWRGQRTSVAQLNFGHGT
jgi:hypothetical protein